MDRKFSTDTLSEYRGLNPQSSSRLLYRSGMWRDARCPGPYRLNGIHQQIRKRLSELVRKGQYTGVSRIRFLDREPRGIHAACQCRDGLIEFSLEVNRL